MDRNAYFGKLIREQLMRLFFDRPLILFIDGRDITKNHQTYHLMTGKFMDAMVKAAESAAGDVPCYIYALLDEVSIVFPNPQKLLQRNEYSYHDEVCGFFLQDFCREFWKTYPEVRFHIKAYNLASSKDIQEFFLWRKERSRLALLVYIAKDYFDPSVYHGKSAEELESFLKEKGLLTSRKAFLSGQFVVH